MRYVEWVELRNDTMYIFWGLMDPIWWIEVSGMYPLIVGVCHMCMILQRWNCYIALNGYQLWICDSGAVWSGYCPISIQLFRGAATGKNLSLITDHKCLSHSLDFGCIQRSRYRNWFWWCLLHLLTLHPCRFPLHMQDMILMRSYYRLPSLAITSVDWCCLYIIICISILHRTWL